MEQYQHVNGVILRSRDYKEADQLLTVYTRELGKITVQARGVKIYRSLKLKLLFCVKTVSKELEDKSKD